MKKYILSLLLIFSLLLIGVVPVLARSGSGSSGDGSDGFRFDRFDFRDRLDNSGPGNARDTFRLQDLRFQDLFFRDLRDADIRLPLGPENNSGQTGEVRLEDKDGLVRVKIRLDDQPLNSVQPAHIHVGNVPNLGAVKYPLNDVVNGESDTILNVSLEQLLSERPLGVNVHKSAAEISVIVASGNL